MIGRVFSVNVKISTHGALHTAVGMKNYSCILEGTTIQTKFPHSGTEPGASRVLSVAFSPSGNNIIACCNAQHVQVLDAATGRVVLNLENILAISCAFSPDGTNIALGCANGNIIILDASYRQTLRLEGHKNWVRTVAFFP